MKSDEIQSLFSTKLETYAPVEGQPSDLDLSALQETLTALLLSIAYNGEKGIHNLSGLIMDEDAYRARHGTNLPTPSRPAIYVADIPINTLNAVRVCREAAHTDKKEDYRLFAWGKRSVRNMAFYAKRRRVGSVMGSPLRWTASGRLQVYLCIQGFPPCPHGTSAYRFEYSERPWHGGPHTWPRGASGVLGD